MALQARNKFSFVDGSCLKEIYATSNVLSAHWVRCNVIVLTWLMNYVSQDVYMSLVYYDNVASVWKELESTYDKVDGFVIFNLLQKVNNVKQGGSSVADYYHRLNSLWREFDALTKLPKYVCEVKCSCTASYELVLHQQLMKLMQFLMGLDDCYQSIRSALLTRDPLHKVGHTIDRCFETIGFPLDFKRNSNAVKQNFNVNTKVKLNDKQSSSSSPFSGFTSEQMQKLLSLINDSPSSNIHANIAGRASFFNGANQHLTASTIGMFNVVDITSLNITVGRPNGTLAIISHVGNFILTSNVVLFDVLVISGYYDLKNEKNLGTGSEYGSLYLFDMIKDNSIGKSNMVMCFNVSMLLWHNRLGHYFDQVPYRVPSREGFTYFLTIIDNYSRSTTESVNADYASDTKYLNLFDNKTSQSPNDDRRATPDENTATQFGNQSSSEGNLSQNYLGQSLSFNETDLEDVQTPGIRMSSRETKLHVRLNDYVLNSNVKYGIDKFVNYSSLKGSNLCFATTLNKSVEPFCLSDPNWVDAMNNEIKALNKNKYLDLVYKAIVVAKGFSQKDGFDYDESFSPMVKMVTVRCLVSIVVVNGWPLYQLDVNIVVLYDDIVKDVYMTLPDGYTSESKSKVCKLNKSLYGLKQALRQCNSKLIVALIEHGFEQRKFDYSLYVKHKGDVFIALLVYVDDIVITRTNKVEINNFTKFLSSKFLIKDLGELKYFLGIEVLKIDKGLCVTQRKYCPELLHEYGLLAARPVNIRFPENYVLYHVESKDDKYLNKSIGYQ
uniref:Reverse transcriptase Ty1/copia-type domain-containing protein n=1 Tax=Tanacetum cinerariifolium TaxID=118510 RepID=A0A6L2L1Y4_TANCI|nr:hypothetical protein [Tanacetum cinerariifolium]